MTQIFVDTSALLPLLDQDDQDHPGVVTALRELNPSETTLITSSYVLVEVGALVRARLGTAALRRLGDTIERGAEVVWVDEELHRRAWKAACKGGKRGPSFVDWVSFLLMAELHIETALALDRHFVQQGFSTLP